jgi:fimbrial isopeptide formation D2 family protein
MRSFLRLALIVATVSTASFGQPAPLPLTIAKAFGAAIIPPGGITSLTFTVSATNALANVSFTDTLPPGMVVATPNGLSTTCGSGTITAVAGSGTISLTGLTFGAAGSCTITANVTATSAATYNNAVLVSDVNAGPGNTATATIVVALPPTIAKAFADPDLQLLGPGNTTTLTFTITNPNPGPALTGIAFVDTLPSGLVVSSPSNLTANCGGVTIATSNSITLSGGALAAGASCTISVNVTAAQIGVQINTTSTVTAAGGFVGNAATAVTTVNDLFFFWFFAESGGGGLPHS